MPPAASDPRERVPSRAVLAALAGAPAPYTTVQLSIESDVTQAQHRLDVRWRDARRALAEQGAAEAVLAAVDAAVSEGHTGGATLLVHTAEDGTSVTTRLPSPPEADVDVRRGPRPHLLPLLRHEQSRLGAVVVAIDRSGADLVVLTPFAGDAEEHVDGDDSHLTRSAPGGWSQRRWQRSAEQSWEDNAGLVAERLAQLVDRYGPAAVLVSGDVRAVQFLREKSPPRVTELVREVGGDYTSTDDVLERASVELQALADARVREQVDRLGELGGAAGKAAHGTDEVLALLQQGQVDVLVLRDDADVLDREVLVGPSPTDAFTSTSGAAASAVDDPQPAPLGDAAAWSALSTDAQVVLVPGAAVQGEPDEGPGSGDAYDADLRGGSGADADGGDEDGSRGSGHHGGAGDDALADGVAAVLRWSSPPR